MSFPLFQCFFKIEEILILEVTYILNENSKILFELVLDNQESLFLQPEEFINIER